jgi:hypothetical protein
MDNDPGLAGRFNLTSETVLLSLAIGLAVVFIGLLVFDFVRRRKRQSHQRHERGGFRARLFKPYRRARALQGELWEMLRERSRHKKRDRRGPPPPPP